jgi:Effector-associated domain 8/CHAT domain
MALSNEQFRKLTSVLSGVGFFEDINGRRAALSGSGLDEFIRRVDLNQSTKIYVSALLRELDQHGTMRGTGKKALAMLLEYLYPDELGDQDRPFIAELIGALGGEMPAPSPDKPAATANPRSQTTIAFFAANPRGAQILDTAREYGILQDALNAGTKRDRFALINHPAATLKNVIDFLGRHDPNILQFSMHGVEEGQLVFDLDLTGKVSLIPIHDLADLLRGRNVQGIVVNACWQASHVQALLGSGTVKFVIGCNDAVDDEAAKAFTNGFYTALCNGDSVAQAFTAGKVHANQHQRDVYILTIAEGVDADKIRF